MKAGWEVKTLGEVCSLITRGIAPKYIENGGVRVLNQKCIRGHSINFDLARRNNSELKRVPDTRLIEIGDVLVNSTGTGTLGRVAQVLETPSEPTSVDTHVTIVRPVKDCFYPAFFGYMLIQIEDELIAAGQGTSGQTELPKKDLEAKFEVSYPTAIEEQKRIVSILDEAFEGLDRARENAEANLKNARELFESFVSEQLISVNAEEYSLSEMLEKGWITSHLDGNHGGNYPKKSEFISSGVPYISANCIVDGEIDVALSKFLPEERADTLKKGTSYDQDVIFAHNATVGPVSVLKTDQPRVLLGTSLTHYRCNQARIDPYFLCYEMRSAEFVAQYKAVMGQATRNQVPITIQRSFKHRVPSLNDQMRVSKAARTTEINVKRSLALYQTKLQDISDLRQSLLQKAFAGELT